MKALLSVSDKTGVVDFAKELVSCGFEIISTSGTMKLLKDSGIPVTSISEITGFPEICEGRVKTLHPKVHGALLARRDKKEHLQELAENSIELIDLVCVNLYPFANAIAKEGCTLEDAIENIDIGGPSMLRSAAKNYASVTVISDPCDYDKVISEIKENGNTSFTLRQELAYKVFDHTSQYDLMIADYLGKITNHLRPMNKKVSDLRYGENPHQKASFYQTSEDPNYNLACAKQLNGKELSYNNIQDANAALNIVREFKEPFCVGLKHMNPCGAAIGKDVVEVWTKAYEADTTSIFGGIVATNCEITGEVAALMKPVFLEVIMAPKFSKEALAILTKKKNLRLLEIPMENKPLAIKDQIVSVNGGYLLQEFDSFSTTKEIISSMTVTDKQPSTDELNDLNFAWKIVKHVKSNAIVVVKDGQTKGIGAGQMNRVGSAKLAIEQAHASGCKDGMSMASDGFFPFDDSVTYAKDNGVTSIVQPGGSVRDEDSVVAANKYGVSMLFTGMRHFKH